MNPAEQPLPDYGPMPGDELAPIRPRVTRAPPGITPQCFLPSPPESYLPPESYPKIAPGMFRTPAMPRNGGGNGCAP